MRRAQAVALVFVKCASAGTRPVQRALEAGALQQQAQLQLQQLLEGEPPPALLRLALARRRVPRAHRLFYKHTDT